MKKIIKVLVLIILLNPSLQCRHTNDFTIQINSVTKLNKDTIKKKIFDHVYYAIDFDLMNNTDSTINFWMVKGLWTENYIFNNKSVYLFIESKGSSRLDMRTIERNQKMNFRAFIGISDTSKLENEVKLGLIFISSKVGKIKASHALIPDWIALQLPLEMLDTKERKWHEEARKNIIWSEPFKVEK